MANYTKTFGTGVIPTFNITPGQGNTSWKYGGDESASILDEYLAQKALAKAEQEDTFTNSTIPSIKKLLFPEADDVEAGVADMVVDEIVNPDRITDEDTGKFYGSPSAATDAVLDENAFDPDRPESWLGLGWDKFKGLFGYDDGGRVGLKDGANESFYVNNRPVSEEVYDLKGRQMDLNPTGMEAFKQMTEQFSDVAPEQIMDIIEDKFPQYMEDPTDPFAGMAYGGRVGLQAGGMPFTPFMDPTYAAQYYNQNFNTPGIVSPAVQPGIDPKATNPDFGSAGPVGPVTLPVEGFGTLSGPSKGPEDRGSYSDRFGTAEDQGYGYSGTPGQGGAATFNNPNYGAYGDTFTAAPGIGQAYDEYGRLRDIGVLNDLGLNLYGAAYPVAKMKPGILGLVDKVVTGVKNYNDKKAKEEQEAKQKQAEEDAVALSKDIKEQFASYNVGGGGNKPDPGTGTFSGGTVSGFTGQGQSPHSSMSTATPSAVAAAQSYAANVAAAQAARDKNKHERERGGGGGAGKGGGKGCFVKGTMIEMADGTEKEITTIAVGELTKGGVVEAKLEFMPTQIYNYKGVEVSGSHLVMENNQFIKVEDSKRSVLTDKLEPVYCFETSDNRIWVKGIEFGDYLTGSHEQWQPHIDAMLETVNLELNGH